MGDIPETAIRDAWKFGSARCEGCRTEIDLSDADSVTEAKKLWNAHVKTECSGELNS